MPSPDHDAFDDIPILLELQASLERHFAASASTPRRAGSSPPSRWWQARRTLGPAGAVAMSVLVAAGIAAVALTSLHHAGRPPAGRPPGHVLPPPSAVGRDINRAELDTVRADPACANTNRGPTFVHGAPSRTLLHHLGVLRRAPLASPTLKTLMDAGFIAGSRIDVDYIRLARVAYGKAFYLIPAGRPAGVRNIADRCYAEMRARLASLTRRMPRAERREAARLQADAFRINRLQARPGLCFAAVTTRHVRPPNGVDSGCGSTTSFLQPGLDGGIGERDRAGGQIQAGVVPDGVASVTLEFKAAGHDPARALMSRAVNNVVVFKIPRRTAHASFPTHIIRRAASGRVISETDG